MTPLLRIVAPHFVAAVIVGELAAPIVRYMTRSSEMGGAPEVPWPGCMRQR